LPPGQSSQFLKQLARYAGLQRRRQEEDVPSRRQFLTRTARLGAMLTLSSRVADVDAAETVGVEVNDVQSRLNATRVHQVLQPASVREIEIAIRDAARGGRSICLAGGRHAMGGQQFGRDAVLLDTKRFNQVLKFDRQRGRIEVEAGIEWPELIGYLHRAQADDAEPWAIREKQTGVDRVSLGGSLASNIHGRGLRFPPIISDVESFVLLDANCKLRSCSRYENSELFALAIGGYGLFGVIVHVTLRLVRRRKVERIVEVIPVKDLLPRVEERIRQGFIYGDCQYSTDLTTDAETHQGVFSCYRPVAAERPIPAAQHRLSAEEWADLYRLARTDKKRAFEHYSKYYLATSGQVYWSDKHQLAGNFDAYRKAVDVRNGTEMITEVYVPKESFLTFMRQARQDFLDHNVDMTYGTIRFIERDEESFLAWAKDAAVCIVCNLHVAHTTEGKRKAAEDFRRIIDRVIELGGRYYLTYHRWASRSQVVACYPQFVEFLKLKRKYDPAQRFQSDWYRHYAVMFADEV
jgi:FAD/FMN-containing dehydrogenase